MSADTLVALFLLGGAFIGWHRTRLDQACDELYADLFPLAGLDDLADEAVAPCE